MQTNSAAPLLIEGVSPDLLGPHRTSIAWAFTPTALLGADTGRSTPGSTVVLPMRLRHRDCVLNLFTTIAIFGTPVDVTVSELAIESFFPADDETASVLRRFAQASGD